MNQVLNNPYPYSSDNKRYQTFSWYLKHRKGKKIAKIPLDAGFTCPNRDGTKGVGGCLFCSEAGSGDTILGTGQSLQQQYALNLERARKKWPNISGMAYFQSYSNTYAPLSRLKELFTPFYEDPSVEAICIATRPDCLNEEMLEWFASFEKDTWIELGLQSIHESTTKAMNRGHSTLEVEEAVEAVRRHGLNSCIHIINGLPGETMEMMQETALAVAHWNPDAIKIHMLHIVDNSPLGKAWQLHPFDLLSQEDYVQIVCNQLEVLPPEMIIERLTGDGVDAHLLAPDWTRRKTAVTNAIDTELFARNSWQGKYYQPIQPEDPAEGIQQF